MYKLKLNFELENNRVDNNLNIVFASLFKQTLERYNEELYREMFTGQNKKIRKYCFCLKMRPLKRQNGKVILEHNKFSLELKSLDFQEFISFYNAFLMRCKDKENFSMNQNSMQLMNVYLHSYKPNISNHVIIKMCSPVVVRSYTDSGERYLGIEDEGFEEVLNKTVNRFLQNISMNDALVHITPLKVKKTVMNLFRFKANANLGIFEITGDPNAIAVLSFAGIGNCRGAGAGMFRIID